MRRARLDDPPPPNDDTPEELEPGAPPVEPDEGLVPPFIPEDPEHDRLVDPAAGAGRPEPRGAKAPDSAPGLALPHERDESTDTTAQVPDPVITQAKRDIDAGMVDTDLRATAGLDAELRARLVPGPSGKPPSPRR